MPETVPARLRPSRDDDLAAIARIYGHHVRHGLASFEETPPDAAELGRRREDALARGLPHLVAEADGRVIGFGYLAPYRLRPAYRHTLENSVYVAPDAVGRGAGGLILAGLIDAACALGCRQMIAVIGDSANRASIRLHASLGFRPAGILRSVGFKHGRWVDSVLMQRAIGEGDATTPAR